MRDSAGDGARVRSARVVAVGRTSPCLLGAFLVVGGRRLDRPPAPFRPGGAIETARRSMAEQCRVGFDDGLGDSKWRRSRRVCLFGLGPAQKCSSRKSQARRFKSRLSCLGRRCRVWCGGVECARVHQLGPSWRSEQGFCRVRKRVVNIWSPIAPDNRLSDPAIGGTHAPHVLSRPLPAGHDVPSQPRQPGACSAHQALSRGRGALLTLTPSLPSLCRIASQQRKVTNLPSCSPTNHTFMV